jgi:hypothetical protein
MRITTQIMWSSAFEWETSTCRDKSSKRTTFTRHTIFSMLKPCLIPAISMSNRRWMIIDDYSSTRVENDQISFCLHQCDCSRYIIWLECTFLHIFKIFVDRVIAIAYCLFVLIDKDQRHDAQTGVVLCPLFVNLHMFIIIVFNDLCCFTNITLNNEKYVKSNRLKHQKL